eukprot:EG_transcript_3732
MSWHSREYDGPRRPRDAVDGDHDTQHRVRRPHTQHAPNDREDSPDPDDTRVFIGGLTPTTTKRHLAQHFAQFGRMETVVCIPTRRFGFVTFQSPEDAAEALDYPHPHIIDGKEVDVKRFVPQHIYQRRQRAGRGAGRGCGGGRGRSVRFAAEGDDDYSVEHSEGAYSSDYFDEEDYGPLLPKEPSDGPRRVVKRTYAAEWDGGTDADAPPEDGWRVRKRPPPSSPVVSQPSRSVTSSQSRSESPPGGDRTAPRRAPPATKPPEAQPDPEPDPAHPKRPPAEAKRPDPVPKSSPPAGTPVATTPSVAAPPQDPPPVPAAAVPVTPSSSTNATPLKAVQTDSQPPQSQKATPTTLGPTLAKPLNLDGEDDLEQLRSEVTVAHSLVQLHLRMVTLVELRPDQPHQDPRLDALQALAAVLRAGAAPPPAFRVVSLIPLGFCHSNAHVALRDARAAARREGPLAPPQQPQPLTNSDPTTYLSQHLQALRGLATDVLRATGALPLDGAVDTATPRLAEGLACLRRWEAEVQQETRTVQEALDKCSTLVPSGPLVSKVRYCSGSWEHHRLPDSGHVVWIHPAAGRAVWGDLGPARVPDVQTEVLSALDGFDAWQHTHAPPTLRAATDGALEALRATLSQSALLIPADPADVTEAKALDRAVRDAHLALEAELDVLLNRTDSAVQPQQRLLAAARQQLQACQDREVFLREAAAMLERWLAEIRAAELALHSATRFEAHLRGLGAAQRRLRLAQRAVEDAVLLGQSEAGATALAAAQAEVRRGQRGLLEVTWAVLEHD